MFFPHTVYLSFNLFIHPKAFILIVNIYTADDKLAAEISTKKMRRKFLESMKNSNPKYYSHQIQQIIPFPEKFPVSNLDYGLKALQMIQTGEITRAGKIQLIDTIFHELIKYTGL